MALTRRQFNTLTLLGLLGTGTLTMKQTLAAPAVQTLMLTANGDMPNNSQLPVCR